jgi:hypothetical protein
LLPHRNEGTGRRCRRHRDRRPGRLYSAQSVPLPTAVAVTAAMIGHSRHHLMRRRAPKRVRPNLIFRSSALALTRAHQPPRWPLCTRGFSAAPTGCLHRECGRARLPGNFTGSHPQKTQRLAFSETQNPSAADALWWKGPVKMPRGQSPDSSAAARSIEPHRGLPEGQRGGEA